MSAPRLGHVLPDRLAEYRYWRDASFRANLLAHPLGLLGRDDLALAMFEAQAVLKARATECRVKLGEAHK